MVAGGVRLVKVKVTFFIRGVRLSLRLVVACVRGLFVLLLSVCGLWPFVVVIVRKKKKKAKQSPCV